MHPETVGPPPDARERPIGAESGES